MAKEHPMRVAQEMALLLQSDPIAAAQIKEIIPEDRLSALLKLGDPFHEEIADLERQVRDLENDCDAYERKVDSYREDLDESNDLILRLQKQIEALTARVDKKKGSS